MIWNNINTKIYNKIKSYSKIVIARHIGADPDALASSIALKDIILNTFPNKQVYVVGTPVSKFKYLGSLDKLPDDLTNTLLIVTDTPDKKRVDGANVDAFKDVIKIDHHPFIEKFGDLEIVDETASSASQLIIELTYKTPLKMSAEASKKLFIGIVADTNRFLYYYTTPKTLDLVSKMFKDTKQDFTTLYPRFYRKSLNDAKFEGYIINHMTVTPDGLAYILLDNTTLNEYKIDATTARNMVSEFNNINEILVWAIFTADNDSYRGSIRSRGPIINEVASHFNGGGHIYACGIRTNNKADIEALTKELDALCHQYKETNN